MARTKRVAKPKKPPKPKPPPKFHEQAGAGSAGKAQGTAPRSLTSAAGAPLSVLELVAAADAAAAGLSAVVLELAGEGRLSIGAALSAWQHEQERVSNRAWRRPGGLARMGGL